MTNPKDNTTSFGYYFVCKQRIVNGVFYPIFYMKQFLVGRFYSIGYALRGAFKLITTEHSVISQGLIAVAMTTFGFWVGISKTEWMFQLLAIGLVMATEGMNTAVEKIADFIHPEHHHKIGFIKDIAAGAVLFAAFAAVSIGLLIYVPYFM